MPSSVRAPTRARIAARISPSVISSQRQITRPKDGSFLISSARSFFDISRVTGHSETSWEISVAAFRSTRRPSLRIPLSFSTTRPERYSPSAGAEVSPGDSTPTALKKPGASGGSPRMKSLTVVSCARRPENSVITLLSGSSGHVRRAPAFAFSRPS